MVIHNPILTGSFTVNNIDVSSITSSAANITALNATTASLNSFSASVLSYTASQNILNGTYTLTSSFVAQTASFTAFTSSINAFSASILAQTSSLNSFSASVLSYTSSLNNKTASFATTGSNIFIGTQTITGSVLQSGSFTSTGTLTAQTLVVQTITSSVVYSSGSNIFGNDISNSQKFTGSVLITGSLTISTGGNVSAPTIFGSTIACSPVGKFTTCLTFGDWTTAANVLSSNKPNEQGAYIRAAVSIPTNPTYAFEDDQDTGMYRDGANSLGFATDGYARMTISSTGYSLFNGTVAIQGACSSRICLIKDYSGSPSNPGFVITDTNGVLTFNHNANGGGTSISGVTCIGSNFCVAGASYFAGNVGIAAIPTGWGSNVNAIELPQAVSLYSWNASAVPQLYLGANHYWDGSNWRYKITGQLATLYYQANGQHQWFNAPSGTAGCVIAFCQAMTLNASGNISIGTISNLTSGAYSSIRLGTIANWWAGNSVGSGDFYLQGNAYYDGSSLKYIRTDAATEYSQVSGFHTWSTAASGTAGCSITMVERMRITNIGNVGIGTASPAYNLHICCSGQVINNLQVNSVSAGSEAGILITTPDSIGLLTVGASDTRGVNDAARCDMVMGLRTGGKIRFTTDVNANITQVSIANGITSFTCQMCAPYAIFSGTAAITLPVGTTAQRPGPSTGMIRFNSSCTELEYYNGNNWLFFTATPESQGYYVDVLVVGGGGGGGGAEASNGYGGGGAGGGAGGYMAGRIFINYTNCGYPISIGGGGTGGANEGQSTGSGCNGTTGTASCALGLIAIGGGFGAGDETQTGGGNGGSGGGNGGDNSGTQGCGTLGQGCAGGYANTRNGGGGGGASTTGCHGYGGSGAGGQGRAWYNGTTYAGGGGGGNGSANNTTTCGGAGGGGKGSATDGTAGAFQPGGTATAGTANTGGGGGAGAAGRAQGGQNGGSGIVIVRYYGSQKGFGGTITSSGGYTYHSFTSSGTYCATYY